MFQFVLSDYHYEKIHEAFKFYLSTSNELPTHIEGAVKLHPNHIQPATNVH